MLISHTGSCLHYVTTLSHPRWEDYNYELLDESKTQNRFYWLGDGSTYNEKHMVGDRTLIFVVCSPVAYR